MQVVLHTSAVVTSWFSKLRCSTTETMFNFGPSAADFDV